MKKILSAFLCAAIALNLCACGESKTPTGNNSPTPQQPSANSSAESSSQSDVNDSRMDDTRSNGASVGQSQPLTSAGEDSEETVKKQQAESTCQSIMNLAKTFVASVMAVTGNIVENSAMQYDVDRKLEKTANKDERFSLDMWIEYQLHDLSESADEFGFEIELEDGKVVKVVCLLNDYVAEWNADEGLKKAIKWESYEPWIKRSVESTCISIQNIANTYAAMVMATNGVSVEDSATKYGVDMELEITHNEADMVSCDMYIKGQIPKLARPDGGEYTAEFDNGKLVKVTYTANGFMAEWSAFEGTKQAVEIG